MDSLLPKIPVWVYRLLAIFPATGMVGIDHFAIGSKETGMAKALINLLTFGSWYFFDIAQSLDSNKLVKEGLGIPFYGQVGIGKEKLGDGVLGSGDSSVKFWLNILFIFAGFTVAGIAGFFVFQPNPWGGVAKAVAGTATAIALSIISMTVYSSFAKVAPSNLMGAAAGLMKGGGEEEGATLPELFTLGTLAVLTITGFVLHSVRNGTA
jgi:hypothetical protein